MPEVHIGTLQRARLTLDVLRRQHPNANDYWDGNWLLVDVHLDVGGWRGRYEASLRVDEFDRFLADVRLLQGDLGRTATFEAMEPWLGLRLEGDGLGHIRIRGEAQDEPGLGNTLSFHIDLDQTWLPALARGLEAVLTAFPIVGHPSD